MINNKARSLFRNSTIIMIILIMQEVIIIMQDS